MRLRSLLFAPAVSPELLRKLPRSGADGVVIDCEDATPPAAKGAGRRNARAIGEELAVAGSAVWVRVNGVDSPWFHDDIAGGIPAGARGVVVPKVERAEHLEAIRSSLAESDRAGLAVMAGLETAQGVASARELLRHPVVSAAYFGAEDFVADMGGRRTESNTEVLHARSEVALAARVAEVPVLDQVVVAYRDDDRFVREASEASAMGYAGKLCIHPAQVALAHAAFTPSAEEVAAARALVEAYEQAVRRGSSVVVVDGRMVDGPVVDQARRLLVAAGEE